MHQISWQGITVNPVPTKVGDRCNISYEGLLKKSGADQVFLHCGYGPEWSNAQYIPMYNTATGCTCDFTVNQDGNLNFCFKDSANHWDNNSGQNWAFFVRR